MLEERKKVRQMSQEEIVTEFSDENGVFQPEKIIKSIHSSLLNAAQTFISGVIKLSVFFIELFRNHKKLEKRVENLEKLLQNSSQK